eukprot:scaffold2752_cov393-Prasinococcus_capsulatus_cf.AAC.49
MTEEPQAAAEVLQEETTDYIPLPDDSKLPSGEQGNEPEEDKVPPTAQVEDANTSNQVAAEPENTGEEEDTAPTKVELPEKGPEKSARLVILGLKWETTDATLLEYFSQFGTVVEHTIMKARSTGKSRGFGFVTYESGQIADSVENMGKHSVDGRQVGLDL